MTQNIYDNPEFLTGYQRLPRSVLGLDGAPEWPTLRSLLPELDRATVLDLGCGFGWFCRWAAMAGATRVVGVDISERMLERARADTDDSRVEYRRADLEQVQLDQVELEPGSAELAYSSLALHYIVDLPRLLTVVHAALVPGGRFVFSVEHPVVTAPSTDPGFVEADGRIVWPVDSYLHEGERTTNWFVEGVVKQHRTIATYLNALIAAGFTIKHVDEWGPTAEQIDEFPGWAKERDRPPFLLVACERT